MNNIQYSSTKFIFFLFADDTNILYADKHLRSLEPVGCCRSKVRDCRIYRIYLLCIYCINIQNILYILSKYIENRRISYKLHILQSYSKCLLCLFKVAPYGFYKNYLTYDK